MKDHHINIFYSDELECYVADIPDLVDCISVGQTPAEALSKVQEAKDRWLEAAGSEGLPIPEPDYRPEIYPVSDLILPKSLGLEEPRPDAQYSYNENLEYIATKVRAHKCILFLGSAIHVPPPPSLSQYNYPAAKAPPIGVSLSKRLAVKSAYTGRDWWNLQRVAQHFESTTKSRFRLVEEITEAVHVGREPSPILGMLAELKFPIVITTNYDQLYEQALDNMAKERGSPEHQYQISIYTPNNEQRVPTIDCPARPDPARPFILKIHGDLTKSESIVITDEDYIHFVLRMSDTEPYHPFGPNVLAHLTRWSILFVGYSLMDYNLRLLFKTLRWKLDPSKIPPTFSVDRQPDKLIRDVWENQRRYVSFIVLNLWDFVPKLHALVGPT